MSSASVFHMGANLQSSVKEISGNYFSLPLAVTAPMVVELDEPHGVGVVDVRHVVIIEVHHIRVIIQADVTWTN